MARPVRMPPLGATSDELRIVQWLKEVGAAVEQGEMLLEVETDKATLEVEAAVSGTLLAVLHGPGETVTVGEVLAFVGSPGEEVPAVEPPAAAKKQAVPVARKLAQEHGIDLASVQGSGPGGRIEKQDVLALIDAHRCRRVVELSRHRRAVAERLTRSVQTIPQFSVGVDVDMSSAAAQLAQARADGLAGLTYTHLLLRATAAALREHPALNRLWVSRGAAPAPARAGRRRPRRGRRGHAARADDRRARPPRALRARRADRGRPSAWRARARSPPAPVAITLSNLGMFGVDRFTAIVDPDQTAILAVGAVRERARRACGSSSP